MSRSKGGHQGSKQRRGKDTQDSHARAGGASAAASKEREGHSPPEAALDPKSDPCALNPRRVLLAAGMGGLALTVYLSTLFPSVAGGDSTEFAFSACQFSVPHPPGYPTFLTISHLFYRFLPWGSPAARANAAAAACASGASAMVFLAAEASTGSEPAALLAGGLFSFGRLVWSYAIQSEVFALNNFFAATLLYLAARYERWPSDQTAYTGALFCGLALTNQHTIVFFIAPVILFVLFTGWRSLLQLHKVLVLCRLLFAGMLPYLIIAWRSRPGLPGSWGDLTTVDGFLTHLFRREYGTFRLFAGAERGDHRFLLGLKMYFFNVVEDTSLAGVALLGLGILLVLCRAGVVQAAAGGTRTVLLPGARIAAVCWLLYTVVFHYIGNLPIEKGLYLGVHARFWMQSHVASHQLLAVGAAGVGRAMDSALLGAAPSSLSLAPSTAVAMAAVAMQFGRNFREMDESDNYYSIEYGRELLRPLPENARVIVKGDMITNTARYLQVCEGYRTDVEMVDMSMMTYPWFKEKQAKNVPSIVWPNKFYHPFEPDGFSMRTFLDANTRPPKTEMFMAGGWHPEDPTSHGVYDHLPWGFADKVVRVDSPNFDFQKWRKQSKKALPRLHLPEKNYTDDRWESVVVKDYYQAVHKRAHRMLQWCERHGEDVAVLREAERAMEGHPNPEAYMLRNLGVVKQQLLRTSESSDQLYTEMAETFRRYLALANPQEPGLDAVREVIRIYDTRVANGDIKL